MKINRRHRIISGINMIVLVFNLLVPLMTPTPAYAKAPTKKEIRKAGGSMVVGKYVFWIDKNGKMRRRKGNTVPAGMQVYTDNHPEYYAQFITTGTKGKGCKTAWCAAAGGFCMPETLYKKGWGCNQVAELAFGIEPCYDTGTCNRCLVEGCRAEEFCTAEGYCIAKSEANTAVVDGETVCVNPDGSQCIGIFLGTTLSEDGDVLVLVNGQWKKMDPDSSEFKELKDVQREYYKKIAGKVEESQKAQREEIEDRQLIYSIAEYCLDSGGMDTPACQARIRRLGEELGRRISPDEIEAVIPEVLEFRESLVPVEEAVTGYSQCRSEGGSDEECREQALKEEKLVGDQAEIAEGVFDQMDEAAAVAVAKQRAFNLCHTYSYHSQICISALNLLENEADRDEVMGLVEEKKSVEITLKICVKQGRASTNCGDRLADLTEENQTIVLGLYAERVRQQREIERLYTLAVSGSDAAVAKYIESQTHRRGDCQDDRERCREEVLKELEAIDPRYAEAAQTERNQLLTLKAIGTYDLEGLKDVCYRNYESSSEQRRICDRQPQEREQELWYKRLSKHLIRSEFEEEDQESLMSFVDFQTEAVTQATPEVPIEEVLEKQAICSNTVLLGSTYEADADRCVIRDEEGVVMDVKAVEASEEVKPRTFLGITGCTKTGWVYDKGYGGCIPTNPEEAITGTYIAGGVLGTEVDECEEGYRPVKKLLPLLGGNCIPDEGGPRIEQVWNDNVGAVTSVISGLGSLWEGFIEGRSERILRTCKELAHDEPGYAGYDRQCIDLAIKAELDKIEDNRFIGEGIDEAVLRNARVEAVYYLLNDGTLEGGIEDYVDTLTWELRSDISESLRSHLDDIAEQVIERKVTNVKVIKMGGGMIWADEYAVSLENIVAYYEAVGKTTEGEVPINPYVYTGNEYYRDGEWHSTVSDFIDIGVEDVGIEIFGLPMSEPNQRILFGAIFYTRRWANQHVIAAEPAFRWEQMIGDGRESFTTILAEQGIDFNLATDSYSELADYEQVVFTETAEAVDSFVDLRAENGWVHWAIPAQNALAVGVGVVAGILTAEMGPVSAVVTAVSVETAVNSATQALLNVFIETPRERLVTGLQEAADDPNNAAISDTLEYYVLTASEIEREREEAEFKMNVFGDVILGGLGESIFAIVRAGGLDKVLIRQVASEAAESLTKEEMEALGTEGVERLIKDGYLTGVLSDGSTVTITKSMWNSTEMAQFIAFKNIAGHWDEATALVKGLRTGPGFSPIKRYTWSEAKVIDQVTDALRASGSYGDDIAEGFVNSRAIQNIINPSERGLKAWFNKQKNKILGESGEAKPAVVSLDALGETELLLRQGDEVMIAGEKVVLGEGAGTYVRIVDADGNIKFAGQVLEDTELPLGSGYRIQLSETARAWQEVGQLAQSTVGRNFDEIGGVVVHGGFDPSLEPALFSSFDLSELTEGTRIYVLGDDGVEEMITLGGGGELRLVDADGNILGRMRIDENMGLPTDLEQSRFLAQMESGQELRLAYVDQASEALTHRSTRYPILDIGDRLYAVNGPPIIPAVGRPGFIAQVRRTITDWLPFAKADQVVVGGKYISIDGLDDAARQLSDLGIEPGTRVRLSKGWRRTKVFVTGADGQPILRNLTVSEWLADRLPYAWRVVDEADLATGKVNWGQWWENQRLGRVVGVDDDLVVLPGRRTVIQASETVNINEGDLVRIIKNDGEIVFAGRVTPYTVIEGEYLQAGYRIEVKTAGYFRKVAGEKLAAAGLEALPQITADGARVLQRRTGRQILADATDWIARIGQPSRVSEFTHLQEYSEKVGLSVVEDAEAHGRVMALGGKIDKAEKAFRIKIPADATPALVREIEAYNALIDRYERYFGHHAWKDQAEALTAHEELIRLGAGRGKTKVVLPLDAASKRTSVTVLQTAEDAKSYVNDILKQKEFFEGEGIEIVYYDYKRGWLEVTEGFEVQTARVIDAEEMVELAKRAAKAPDKAGLMIITENSNNAWGLISGRKGISPDAEILYEVLLGDAYGGKGYALLVDEIGAQVNGVFSVSEGLPKTIISLDSVDDAVLLAGFDSGDELLQASRQVSEISELQNFRSQVHSALEGTGKADSLFASFEVDGVIFYKPWPGDEAVIGRSFREIIEQTEETAAFKSLAADSSIRQEIEGLVKALGDNPEDVGLHEQLQTLLSRPGVSQSEREVLADLAYRKADLQARWYVLSRTPGTHFGQEGTEIVLRGLGGTTGETYSEMAQRIALQDEGADMLAAAGKYAEDIDVNFRKGLDVDADELSAIHDLYVDADKLSAIDDLKVTPDSDKITNEYIYQHVRELRGYDATPTTAANRLGKTVSAASERPPDPTRLFQGMTAEETIAIGIKDSSYQKTVKGKAKGWVIAGEGTSYGRVTTALIDAHPETEVMFRTKYIIEPDGSIRLAYSEEILIRGADEKLIGKEINKLADQDAWNKAIQARLEDDPNKVLIVYEGRTRAVDLEVTDMHKNIRWSVYADGGTDMEVLTQSVGRNRVLAQPDQWRAAWSEADFKGATEYNLFLASDRVGLTAENVVDKQFKVVLNEQLASTRYQSVIRSYADSYAEALALPGVRNEILESVPARYRKAAEQTLDELMGDAERVGRAQALEIQFKPLTGDEIPNEVWLRGQQTHDRLEGLAVSLKDNLRIRANEVDELMGSLRTAWGIDETYIPKDEFTDIFNSPARVSSFEELPKGPSEYARYFAETNDPDTLPKYAWNQRTDPESARVIAEQIEEVAEVVGRGVEIITDVRARVVTAWSDALADVLSGLSYTIAAGTPVFLAKEGLAEAVFETQQLDRATVEDIAREVISQMLKAGKELEFDDVIQIGDKRPIQVRVVSLGDEQMAPEVEVVSANISRVLPRIAGDWLINLWSQITTGLAPLMPPAEPGIEAEPAVEEEIDKLVEADEEIDISKIEALKNVPRAKYDVSIEKQLFRIGEIKNIQAHGIEEEKDGIESLFKIMFEGLRGNKYEIFTGTLISGNPALFAGAHGPYYVTFLDNTRHDLGVGKEVIPPSQHEAYLVPGEVEKQRLLQAIDEAISQDLITASLAAIVSEKIFTYTEYLAVTILTEEELARFNESEERVARSAELRDKYGWQEIVLDSGEKKLYLDTMASAFIDSSEGIVAGGRDGRLWLITERDWEKDDYDLLVKDIYFINTSVKINGTTIDNFEEATIRVGDIFEFGQTKFRFDGVESSTGIERSIITYLEPAPIEAEEPAVEEEEAIIGPVEDEIFPGVKSELLTLKLTLEELSPEEKMIIEEALKRLPAGLQRLQGYNPPTIETFIQESFTFIQLYSASADFKQAVIQAFENDLQTSLAFLAEKYSILEEAQIPPSLKDIKYFRVTSRSYSDYQHHNRIDITQLPQDATLLDIGSGLFQELAQAVNQSRPDITTISLDASLALPINQLFYDELTPYSERLVYEIQDPDNKEIRASTQELRQERLEKAQPHTMAAVLPHIPLNSNSINLVLDSYGPAMYLNNGLDIYFSEIYRVLAEGGAAHIYPVTSFDEFFDAKDNIPAMITETKTRVSQALGKAGIPPENYRFYEQSNINKPSDIRLGLIINKSFPDEAIVSLSIPERLKLLYQQFLTRIGYERVLPWSMTFWGGRLDRLLRFRIRGKTDEIQDLVRRLPVDRLTELQAKADFSELTEKMRQTRQGLKEIGLEVKTDKGGIPQKPDTFIQALVTSTMTERLIDGSFKADQLEEVLSRLQVFEGEVNQWVRLVDVQSRYADKIKESIELTRQLSEDMARRDELLPQISRLQEEAKEILREIDWLEGEEVDKLMAEVHPVVVELPVILDELKVEYPDLRGRGVKQRLFDEIIRRSGAVVLPGFRMSMPEIQKELLPAEYVEVTELLIKDAENYNQGIILLDNFTDHVYQRKAGFERMVLDWLVEEYSEKTRDDFYAYLYTNQIGLSLYKKFPAEAELLSGLLPEELVSEIAQFNKEKLKDVLDSDGRVIFSPFDSLSLEGKVAVAETMRDYFLRVTEFIAGLSVEVIEPEEPAAPAVEEEPATEVVMLARPNLWERFKDRLAGMFDLGIDLTGLGETERQRAAEELQVIREAEVRKAVNNTVERVQRMLQLEAEIAGKYQEAMYGLTDIDSLYVKAYVGDATDKELEVIILQNLENQGLNDELLAPISLSLDQLAGDIRRDLADLLYPEYIAEQERQAYIENLLREADEAGLAELIGYPRRLTIEEAQRIVLESEALVEEIPPQLTALRQAIEARYAEVEEEPLEQRLKAALSLRVRYRELQIRGLIVGYPTERLNGLVDEGISLRETHEWVIPARQAVNGVGIEVGRVRNPVSLINNLTRALETQSLEDRELSYEQLTAVSQALRQLDKELNRWIKTKEKALGEIIQEAEAVAEVVVEDAAALVLGTAEMREQQKAAVVAIATSRRDLLKGKIEEKKIRSEADLRKVTRQEIVRQLRREPELKGAGFRSIINAYGSLAANEAMVEFNQWQAEMMSLVEQVIIEAKITAVERVTYNQVKQKIWNQLELPLFSSKVLDFFAQQIFNQRLPQLSVIDQYSQHLQSELSEADLSQLAKLADEEDIDVLASEIGKILSRGYPGDEVELIENYSAAYAVWFRENYLDRALLLLGEFDQTARAELEAKLDQAVELVSQQPDLIGERQRIIEEDRGQKAVDNNERLRERIRQQLVVTDQELIAELGARFGAEADNLIEKSVVAIFKNLGDLAALAERPITAMPVSEGTQARLSKGAKWRIGIGTVVTLAALGPRIARWIMTAILAVQIATGTVQPDILPTQPVTTVVDTATAESIATETTELTVTSTQQVIDALAGQYLPAYQSADNPTEFVFQPLFETARNERLSRVEEEGDGFLLRVTGMKPSELEKLSENERDELIEGLVNNPVVVVNLMVSDVDLKKNPLYRVRNDVTAFLLVNTETGKISLSNFTRAMYMVDGSQLNYALQDKDDPLGHAQREFEWMIGVPVDVVTVIDRSRLWSLFDALFPEGLEINVPGDLVHPEGNRLIFAKGIQEMNGEELVKYISFRKGDSEFNRQFRAMQVLYKVFEELLKSPEKLLALESEMGGMQKNNLLISNVDLSQTGGMQSVLSRYVFAATSSLIDKSERVAWLRGILSTLSSPSLRIVLPTHAGQYIPDKLLSLWTGVDFELAKLLTPASEIGGEVGYYVPEGGQTFVYRTEELLDQQEVVVSAYIDEKGELVVDYYQAIREMYAEIYEALGSQVANEQETSNFIDDIVGGLTDLFGGGVEEQEVSPLVSLDVRPLYSGYGKAVVGDDGRFVWDERRSRPIDPAIIPDFSELSLREKLEQAINFLNIESADNLRYQQADGETWCNIFVSDFTTLMGVPIPHWVAGSELSGNTTYDWLIDPSQGSFVGWQQVTAEEAQDLANQGLPVIGAYRHEIQSGHVFVVYPGEGIVVDNNFYPTIANVGVDNFIGNPDSQWISGVSDTLKYFVNYGSYQFVDEEVSEAVVSTTQSEKEPLTVANAPTDEVRFALVMQDFVKEFEKLSEAGEYEKRGTAFKEFLEERIAESEFAYLLESEEFQAGLRHLENYYGTIDEEAGLQEVQCVGWTLLLSQAFPEADFVVMGYPIEDAKQIFKLFPAIQSESGWSKTSMEDNVGLRFYDVEDLLLRTGDAFLLRDRGDEGHIGLILHVFESEGETYYIVSESNADKDGLPETQVMDTKDLLAHLGGLDNVVFIRSNASDQMAMELERGVSMSQKVDDWLDPETDCRGGEGSVAWVRPVYATNGVDGQLCPLWEKVIVRLVEGIEKIGQRWQIYQRVRGGGSGGWWEGLRDAWLMLTKPIENCEYVVEQLKDEDSVLIQRRVEECRKAVVISLESVEEVCQLTGQDESTVKGTDLGIMVWHEGRMYFLFGDTNTLEAVPASHVSNVLALGDVSDPSQCIDLTYLPWDEVGRGVIPRVAGEVTVIPTGGISVNGKLYVFYMSIDRFTGYGTWEVNYSGLAVSEDGGLTFTRIDNLFGEGSNFAQIMPFTVKGDDYVYFYGIPEGRFGGAVLGRVWGDSIENSQEYEFCELRDDECWWSNEELEASVLVNQPVGEVSIMKNDYLDKWMMAYLNEESKQIEYRLADDYWGPWSEAETLVDCQGEYAVCYGAFMHPEMTENGGQTVYFNMSLWGDYNVFQMEVEFEQEFIESED